MTRHEKNRRYRENLRKRGLATGGTARKRRAAQNREAARLEAIAADDYSRHPGNMDDDEFVDFLMEGGEWYGS